MSVIVDPAAAAAALLHVGEAMGHADRDRIAEVADLVSASHAGKVSLLYVVRRLYPLKENDDALTALRQLRKRFREAAERLSIDVALVSDAQTRSPLSERQCWVEGSPALLDATGSDSLTAVDNHPEQDIIHAALMRAIQRRLARDPGFAKKLLEILLHQ